MRLPPHCRDRQLIVGPVELTYWGKAEAFVTAGIAGVARLQVSRCTLGVDPRQVVGEQSHAQTLSAMLGMGAEKAQVVVRRLRRMGFLKSFEQLQDYGKASPEKTTEQRLDRSLLLLGQLSPAGGIQTDAAAPSSAIHIHGYRRALRIKKRHQAASASFSGNAQLQSGIAA
jgi:hypothetical protein